jgi:hypothetical protein
METVPPADPDITPIGSNNGPTPHAFGGDSGNRWQHQLAPLDPGSQTAPINDGRFNTNAPLNTNMIVANLVDPSVDNVTKHNAKIVTEKAAEIIRTSSGHQTAPMLELVIIGPSAMQARHLNSL